MNNENISCFDTSRSESVVPLLAYFTGCGIYYKELQKTHSTVCPSWNL